MFILDQAASSISTLRGIYSLLPKFLKEGFIELTLWSLASGIFEIILLVSIGQFVADIGSGELRDSDLLKAVLVSVAAIFAGCTRVRSLSLSSSIAASSGSFLATRALHDAIYSYSKSEGFYSDSFSLTLATKRVDDTVINFLMPVTWMLSSGTIFICVVIFLLVWMPVTALVSSALIGSIYYILIRFTKPALKRNNFLIRDLSPEIVAEIRSYISDRMTRVTTGRVYWPRYEQRFFRLNQTLRKAQTENEYLGNVPRFGIESAAIALFGGVIFAYIYTNQAFGLEPIVLFGIAAQRIAPLAHQIYRSWAMIQSTSASANQFFNKRFDAIDLWRTSQKETWKPEKLTIGLIESSISRQVTIDLFPGKWLAITGESGVGKSTLLKSILFSHTRGVDSLLGSIRVNQLYQDMDMPVFNSYLGYLEQSSVNSPYLSDVRSFLSMNSSIALSSSSVYTSLRATQLVKGRDEISTFLRRKVNDEHEGLSGGEMQRLLLARLLVIGHPVLLLDEFTSALDISTEGALLLSLKEFYPGLIIITTSHREAVVSSCDYIIEITRDNASSCRRSISIKAPKSNEF